MTSPGHPLFLVAIWILSWILDHLPWFFTTRNRAKTDILHCISASYKRISTSIFGGVGRGRRTNRLDFGGYADHDPDPGFLNPDQDLDPDGFDCMYCSLQGDSTRQVLVTHFMLYEVIRSNVKVGASLHYSEWQSSHKHLHCSDCHM